MRNFTKTGSDGLPSLCTPTTLYPNQIKWTKFLPLILGFLFFTAAYANATDVGGYVYCDKNNNGSYNSGEELEVAGLEVKIYNKGTSTLLKTVTTDENGYYNATPIANGTQVDAKVVYNGTTYTVTVTSPTSSAHIKVVCAPTTCTTCTSLNLVTNPTFDSNSNGWTATNGEVITATGGPSALGRYLILNNDNKSGNYSVYQDVAIGGNKQYNYSGVAAKHTQGNNSKIYLEFYNGSTKIGNTAAFFVTVNFNTTAFQSYSFDGYTPANTTKIRIVGYANGTALKLDNQKLTTCNDTPTLTVAKDGDLTCNDTSVKLTATSTPSSGVTYDWTVPNGATDPGNVASFDTGTPGTYSVKVTIPGTGAGCSATKSITVTKTECAPCTTCVSVNLVTNPNFDSNTNSWTATNGELSYGTGGAFGGFLVLNNSDKSGNYYVYQDITLGPNKYYNYTGKAAKHGSGNNAKVYLEFYNGSTKIGTTSEFSVTKNYDGTFQDITPIIGYTPANTTKIRIVGYANGTALKLDSQILTTCNDTPTISVVNDGKLTCTKTSTTVTATANPNSGVTYTWTVPNGATNPGNVASFSATVAGVYKVKVTIPGTGNGCSAEATTTVEEDKTPPTVTASNSGPLSCSQTSVTISATPTSGVSYVWTVPNGVTNPGNVASFSTTKEGVYTVVVKNNSNGCTASKSTTVTTDNTVCCLTITNPLPTLKSICAGASVTLTATTNAVSPVEIEWVRFDAEVTDPYTATGNGKTSLGSVVPSGGSASISSTNFPAVNGQVKTYYVYACFKNAPSACKGFVKHQINVLKPTVTATGGAISCTNTSVQLTATGSPTAGVTSSYSWTGPGGFTSASQSPTVSVAGNYEVTYSVTKDATTCTVKATATVTGDATKPTVSLNTIKLTCTTTSATLTATTTPASGLTYAWTVPNGVTNPGNVASFTVSVAGTYAVTVTNPANGCTATATTNVTQDATKPTVSLNTIKLTCTTTSATLTATTTPASGLTYAWTVPNGVTNPGNVASFTVSVAGTYAVTVTNPANGCTATATTNVTQDATKPTVSLNTIKLTCTTTSATLTATTTPASGLTYAWTVPNGVTNPGNVASFTVSVAGTYAVTVTNPANGCTASDTAVVTQDNNKPTVTATGGQLTCDKTSLSITANGSPASVTYAWTGPGGFTATTKTITASAVGTYTVTVKNPANGCTASDTAIVTQDNNKPTVTATGGQLTCDKTSLSITANGSPATVTYAWTGPGGFTATTKTITASAVGTYTVTVKNLANGCTASDTAIVTQDSNKPTVTATGKQLTCQNTSVSITATGTPSGVTFSWTGPGNFTSNSATITVNTVGIYTVTATNPANGCTASDTAVVTQSTDKPTVSLNDLSFTCLVSSGTLTATGSANVDYTWTVPAGVTNPGNVASFTVTVPGNYMVMVTSKANGCTATATSTVVLDNKKPVITLNAITLTCENPSQTLTATVTPSTGVTYKWTVPQGVTDPGNVASFMVTVAGTYSVTVTNTVNGCQETASKEVKEDQTKPTVTATGGQLTCDKTSLSITANGSPASVTYAWTGPGGFTATTKTITASAVGTYTVTVTNPLNGCTASDTANVTQDNNKPTVTATGGQLTCDKTSLSITANSSPASVTYAWTGPGGFTATTKTITASTVGTYTVTVTNPANGCTASDTAVVTQSTDKPSVSLNEVVITCEQPSATLTATASPANVSYTWTVPAGVTNPGNVASFTVSVAGTYSVTVTNLANSCTATANTTVTGSTVKPTVIATGGLLTCDKTSIGIKATATPAGVTYSWTGPGNFTSSADSINLSTAGVYTITVTNPLNGCTASDTAKVTQDTNKPTVTATGGQLTCDKTSILITANGSPASVTYAWTGPGGFTATTKTITASTAGTYTVTVTNPANGCTASDTAVVTQSTDKPTVSLNEVVITCEQPSAILTATASPANVNYTWTVPAGVTNPGNVASFTVSVAGDYTVVVTAQNGCTASATTKVTGSTDKPTVTVSVANQGQLTCEKPTLVIKAAGTPQGVTYLWSGPGGITATTDSITATAPGIYKVVVTNPANGCTARDSVTITQSTDKPVVTLNDVTLTCDKPTATLTATATPSTGITYKWTVPAGATDPGNVASFTVTVPGEYVVMVTSVANGCTATATTQVKLSEEKPDANPNGNISLICQGSTPITTATLDAKPYTGAQWSQVGTLPSVVVFANVNDPKTTVSGLSAGTYKLVWKAGDCADTLTIVVPDCNVNCVKPEAGPDVVVCAPATTSDLPDAGTNQIWEVGAPNPAPATINPQTGAVAGLTKDGIYSFILKDSNIGSTCADTVYIFRGIANAPDDQSTCNDTLTLAAVAGGTYSVMVGNPAPATITAAGKISGLSTVGVYKFLLTKGQCTDTVKVEKLNCTKVYDLALDKAISKKVAQLGDTLTYTIRVWNEGEATAHGIEVTDTLNAGVQYLSYTSTVGTYNAGKWKFDSIVVGDTVSLYVKVRVVAQGVWFNTAEITKMTETDEDSTPGNGEDDEDDIDRECFTVPIEVCRGQAYVATVPAKYTNVVWFKDGQQVATGNTYTVSESGQYTFTATGAQCPAQGCCPIMVAVIDCCPVDVCVPVVIKKTRTAVR